MNMAEQVMSALEGGSRCVVIRGAAGTGKTTLIASLLPLIRAKRFSPVIMAPTGRAAKMVMQRTGAGATTIHSAIYSPPSEPSYDEKLGSWVWHFSLKRETPADSVIIVDEASMVGLAVHAQESLRFGSGSLLKDLVQWAGMRLPNCRNKIVFVGDPYQLPPVGEKVKTPPALDPACLFECIGSRAKVFDLTDIHRQGEGSGILEEATRLRVRMASGNFGEYVCQPHADVGIVSSDDLTRLYRPQENIDDKIIIAQTNVRVWEYNAVVRRLLGQETALPQAGERLLSLRNTKAAGDDGCEHMFTNGDILQVVETTDKDFRLDGFYRMPGSEETLHFPFLFRQMTVAWPYEEGRRDATVWVNLSPIASREWRENEKCAVTALFTAVDAAVRKKYKGLPKEVIQKKISESPLLKAPIVTFGYALTAHKAQGGEWSDVWVDYRYTQNQCSEDYFRWAYTATTRARKRLFAIAPPNFDDLLAALDRGLERTPSTAENGGQSEPKTLRTVLADYNLVPMNQIVQNWAYRVYVADKNDPNVELGNVTVGYNGKGKVSHVLPRITGLSEALLSSLRTLVGASVDYVLEKEQVAPASVVEDVKPIHGRVVARLKAALDGKIAVTAFRSLTEHQLRVEFATRLGAGYVDWYFDRHGRVSEMGTSTLSRDDLMKIRKAVADD